ncbi:MAG: hypothetical protein JW904_07135 [Spirochaetales bacterium]|nr:hypothetical protein [Spirochaetales bacterium]
MNKLFLAAVCIFLVCGCGNTGNITLNSLTKDEIKQIEDIDHSFLVYWHTKNPNLLTTIERALDNFMRSPIIEKPVKARLHAMYAELYFYRAEPEKMQKSVDEASILDQDNERLYIVKTIIEKEEGKKMTVLETGYKKARERSLIALFLAEMYFSKADYNRALPFYDEAFQGLSKNYLEYYQKNRDLSFHFKDHAGATASAADIAKAENLKTGQVITYVLSQTSYLDSLTFDKDLSAKKLLELLKEKEYIHNKNATENEIMFRKDIAYFLVHIVAYLENDPKLLEKTSNRYSLLNKASPIADVGVSDYFFDGVFILVEKEILNLPDGMNFFPGRTMSGIEFLDVLKKMKARYSS